MKQQSLKIYICLFIVKSRYNSSKKVDYFYLTFWWNFSQNKKLRIGLFYFSCQKERCYNDFVGKMRYFI